MALWAILLTSSKGAPTILLVRGLPKQRDIFHPTLAHGATFSNCKKQKKKAAFGSVYRNSPVLFIISSLSLGPVTDRDIGHIAFPDTYWRSNRSPSVAAVSWNYMFATASWPRLAYWDGLLRQVLLRKTFGSVMEAPWNDRNALLTCLLDLSSSICSVGCFFAVAFPFVCILLLCFSCFFFVRTGLF